MLLAGDLAYELHLCGESGICKQRIKLGVIGREQHGIFMLCKGKNRRVNSPFSIIEMQDRK
ncbi:hypothetical protein KI809_12445 [Geobacter pelophilus]|uniref:Uncharacterized protein n=1 Tax=Geoanaerobacter pelophilus TaxID=60036 RepID=A0AAW4L7T5_9BACT|nr:hypothetical protein [Geoanaerobacter pelophilus]MBT0665108.1 hypothetical protein [Geoanaerobacter pelophilus]